MICMVMMVKRSKFMLTCTFVIVCIIKENTVSEGDSVSNKNDFKNNAWTVNRITNITITRLYTSRKHLRTKVTPDFHLIYSKKEEIWGRNQNDKNG